MGEKNLNFNLEEVKFWERPIELIRINPAGEVPILQEKDGSIISGLISILPHLDEQHESNQLVMGDYKQRAEIRRIYDWFSNKFYAEVTQYVLQERVYKYLTRQGSPNSSILRVAKSNLTYHLEYIKYLLEKNRYIAGNKFSLADIAVAAQLSVLDYLGEVPWTENAVKDWYSVIKSKPSFQPILEDKVKGFRPPKYYNNADF